MLSKIGIIIFLGLSFTACGGNVATNTTNSTSNIAANTPSPVAPANTANTTVNVATAATNAVNANKTANTAAAKPAETGPKRVSFSKGETGSTQSVTLAPGASVQFVLGATGAQTLFVTPASKDLSFKMLKGIGGEFVKADDGTYSAETKGDNVTKGDIVFEVKNPTAKEIKTSIKIDIEDFGD